MMRQMVQAAICATALAAVCGLASGQTMAPTNAKDQRAPRLAAGSGSRLGRQIAALLAEPAVARAHWGVVVTTLDGRPIFGLNQAQLFQPASNAKLFTTSAAMALLGPDTRFETKVVLRGGSVVIVGGGDANLSGREMPYISPRDRAKPPAGEVPRAPLRYLEEMANRVAASGLKVVSKDVVGDDTLFPWEPYPSDWSIDDMVWGYGAPVSALSINDNQIQLTVAPGPWIGREMSPVVGLVPAVPYYTLDVHLAGAPVKTPRMIQIERAPGSKTLRIYGLMATDAQPDVEQVAIEDPAEYAAVAFKAMLEARGVSVRGVARAEHAEVTYSNSLPSGVEVSWEDVIRSRNSTACPIGSQVAEQTLATHLGPTVRDDVTLTNKVSENLHAELLLHHLGRLAFCQFASTRAGLAVLGSFLLHAGIDRDDFVFFDGSGLSGHDLVTPRATAKLLQFATTQPWFPAWKASLPVGGEDGSLESRFAKAPLKDHIFAKTGTLGEARALSGYLDCASGRTVIFSIMVGNHMPGSDADRDVMDRIVAAIAAAD